MKKILQTARAAALRWPPPSLWLATGANRGWTKTSVPVKTLDAVTGIEGVTYQAKFLPGVDFLGAALVGAALLAGISLFFRTKTETRSNNKRNLNMNMKLIYLIPFVILRRGSLCRAGNLRFQGSEGHQQRGLQTRCAA